MGKVLVTGASGFIAQHLVKLLISKGYEVIGTVRSTAKGNKLKENLNSEKFTYTIVEDMMAEGVFDTVLKENPDIEYIYHTASPFFYDTEEPEKDLIIPAIKGTENVLNSVYKLGDNVKKLIVTSSDAAIYSSVDEQNNQLSADETRWNNISYDDAIKDSIAAYYGAKSFAEKSAWNFMKEKSPKFGLAVVNPVYVFGPQAFDNELTGKLNTSNELIGSLLKLSPTDSFDNDKGGFVDVRDVAKGHLAALENEDALGKRLFLTGGKFSTQMMLDIIHKNFPQFNDKLPIGKPNTGEQDISSLIQVNNDATRKLLGFEFSSLETILKDTIDQLLKSQNN